MKITWLPLLLVIPLGMFPQENGNREAAQQAWDRAMKAHQGVPWEKRHVLKSERGFVLHCNTDLETAREYFQAIEKIDLEMEMFFRGLFKKFEGPAETTIYIHRTHEEFMKRMEEDSNTGSITRPSDGSIHTYHGRIGHRGGTVETLAREIARRREAMAVRDRMNIPPWFYRGLAICLGEAIRIPDEGPAEILGIPRQRLVEVKWAVREHHYEKIRDLIRLPRKQYVRLHDAQAWSLVHYIITAGGKGGQKFIGEILADSVDASLTPDDVLKRLEVFGGVEALEKRWKRWVTDLEMPRTGEMKDKDTFRSDYCDASITRPDRKWKFVLDDEDWLFQVGLRKKKATIRLLASNNQSTRRPDAVVAIAEEYHKEIHDVIRVGPVEANGYEAAEIVFEQKASENKDPLRTRRVYVTTPPHIIIVESTAPADEFDDYAEDFEKVVQSLQLYFAEPVE